MITPVQARELARKAVALTSADEAEALVIAERSALTRFANNRINQNVSEEDVLLSVRAVIGKQIGVASTNRIDDDSVAACCQAALAAARIAPEDPLFPGVPEPESVNTPSRCSELIGDFDEVARASAVAAIVEPSRRRGLSAAGKVRCGVHVVAVANSKGVDVGMDASSVHVTVLSAGETGSGWASYLAKDHAELDAKSLGEQAASTAIASAEPLDLEPGVYPVVLGPEAVADILDFLGFVGFSAKSYHEGRSCLSNRLEDQLTSELITIVDDAISDHSLGITFDYEGMPKRRVPIVEDGVAIMPVSDSYWAEVTGFRNTGHALPAPNPLGPLPSNLEILPGDSTLEQLIGRVKRGVFVSRFHYVNVEDPVPVTLTGMTRDGTFLIEDGKITSPLKNLRFTQSAIEALEWCSGVGSERTHVGTEEGMALVPPLLLERFTFTGQTT